MVISCQRFAAWRRLGDEYARAPSVAVFEMSKQAGEMELSLVD